MKKRSITIGICLFLTGLVNAQTCLQTVKDFYQKISQFDNSENGHVLYMKYSTEVYMENQEGPQLSNTELIVGKNQGQLLNDQVRVYKDQELHVSELQDQQLITIGNGTTDYTDVLKQMGSTQQKMLAELKEKSCQSVSGQTNYDHIITATPSEEQQQTMKIASIQYFVNSKTKQVYQAIIKMQKGASMSKMIFTFHQISFNYNTSRLNTSVKNRFFNGNGSLKPQYKTYEIVDLRKK